MTGTARWVAAGIALGLCIALAMFLAARGALIGFKSRTTISQSVVVERLEAVAKLVTTEAMVRDVVTYENTRLGSTKRSLVIVTGKAMVGLDLTTTPPRIDVQQRTRHISVMLPHARLLGVDITELRTYDERRGLWNPFRPADRDTIFMLARRQLSSAARDLAVVTHAEESARRFLTELLAKDGYTLTITFAPPN